MWQAVLRGQEPYTGSVKEQENQSQDVKQECRKSCREKAKSSDAWLWGGWSRSSEITQKSGSNDPASEGLHIVWPTIVLQFALSKDDFG